MTLRAGVRVLRGQTVFAAVRDALRAASRPRFRVVHFSVQDDHVHLIVEASDREALISGGRGLAIRVARVVNRVLGRKGRVWADRHHTRALGTPREVRNALVYVLQNWRKHGRRSAQQLDPCSSAMDFDGWREAPTSEQERGPPMASPRTWLLTRGWRQRGLIATSEQPRQA